MRATSRSLVALILTLLVSNASCTTPVAVGMVVAGGGSLVGAKVMHKPDCDGEGCIYGNLLAALLGSVGIALVAVGGISLAIEKNGTE